MEGTAPCMLGAPREGERTRGMNLPRKDTPLGSARSRLSPDEGRGRDGRVARTLKHAQRIAHRRQEFRHRRRL